ncbi:hypothetical protein BB560_001017 [Smittium megazygosporum]|uniref:Uncharacterized protein n=1 Tax=Smittium megazygosporum TaxID=133381 RepID=A0A2T9ZIR4_9FUNG|nr:hypothetical protein BB560_001017 [Smittium megazygosporum]
MQEIVKFVSRKLEPKLENAFTWFVCALVLYQLFSMYQERQRNRLNLNKSLKEQTDLKRRQAYIKIQESLINRSNSESQNSSEQAKKEDSEAKSPPAYKLPTARAYNSASGNGNFCSMTQLRERNSSSGGGTSSFPTGGG